MIDEIYSNIGCDSSELNIFINNTYNETYLAAQLVNAMILNNGCCKMTNRLICFIEDYYSQ